MNPATGEGSVLTTVIKGSEDYCWTPQGEILMGSGSKLFLWKAGKEWKEIADFSSRDINGITRLSVSPDGKKLALVGVN